MAGTVSQGGNVESNADFTWIQVKYMTSDEVCQIQSITIAFLKFMKFSNFHWQYNLNGGKYSKDPLN